MSGTNPDSILPCSGFYALCKGLDENQSSEDIRSAKAEIIGERREFGSLSYSVEEGDSIVLPFYSDAPRKRLGFIHPLKPVPFTPKQGKYLWSLIRDRVISEDWRGLAFWDPPIAEPWRSNLHSFLVDIFGYTTAVPVKRRTLDVSFIIFSSLIEGPPFADWLDKFKTLIINKKFDRLNLEPVDLPFWPQFESISPCFGEIGDIYRSNSLFRWTPPNPEISEFTEIPIWQDPGTLHMFRDTLREWLSQEKACFFAPINDEWAGNRDNAKIATEGLQWQLKPSRPADEWGQTRLSFIPRELKEARAAVVVPQASLCRIRLIEMNVRKLLHLDRRSKMETHPSQLQAEMKSAITRTKKAGGMSQKRKVVSDESAWSYCRDLKKEGLTKPRNLLRIMLEELHERFPEVTAFNRPAFFDCWAVSVDGKVRYPTRGHGLGMANALTTLMQIIIEEINIKMIKNEISPLWSGYVNDDAAMVFKNLGEAKEYVDIDAQTCSRLGLIFKKKGTFLAKQHVNLCEVYACANDSLTGKRAFEVMAFTSVMKAINCAHARSLTLSMNLSMPLVLVQEVYQFWGPILYRNEHNRPRSQGGWYRATVRGVDVAYLPHKKEEKLSQMEAAARYAWLNINLEREPWRSNNKGPTKRSMVYPNEWLEQRDEKLELTTDLVFRPEMNITENVRSWDSFLKALRKRFSSNCRFYEFRKQDIPTWGDCYLEDAEMRPKEDIIPPLGEWTRAENFEQLVSTELDLVHPYAKPQQAQDLWSFRLESESPKYMRKMNLGRVDISHIKVRGRDDRTPAQRALAMRHLLGLKGKSAKAWGCYLVPAASSFAYWHNPFHVGQISDQIYKDYTMIIPKTLPESKKELLELRKAHYGRDLTPSEWLLLGSVPQSDLILFRLLKDGWNDPFLGGDDTLKKMVNLVRQTPGIGNFIDAMKDHSIDEVASFWTKWVEASLVFQRRRMERGKERAALRNEEETDKIKFKELELLEAELDDVFSMSRQDQKHNLEAFYATKDYMVEEEEEYTELLEEKDLEEELFEIFGNPRPPDIEEDEGESLTSVYSEEDPDPIFSD